MVLTHPNQLLYRLAQSRSAHPTYLTEETGPILSHSRSWHMDWNPAHSGFWPKVCGCCSCRKRKLTTEEVGTVGACQSHEEYMLWDFPLFRGWSPSSGSTTHPTQNRSHPNGWRNNYHNSYDGEGGRVTKQLTTNCGLS